MVSDSRKSDQDFPLPLAVLVRRALHARSPREKHDAIYFAWEASVRLSVVAGQQGDMAPLARGSLGHWVRALKLSEQPLENVHLLECYRLFRLEEGQKLERRISPQKLLEAFPHYRNKVIGHGGARSPQFYDRAAGVLILGLRSAWNAGIFLGHNARLLYVESIEITPSGDRAGRIFDLTGPVARLDRRAGLAPPESLLPRRLYVRQGTQFTSLYPWLLFQEVEVQERILFYNGWGRFPEFLDYSTGDIVKGRELKSLYPSLDGDLSAIFGVKSEGPGEEGHPAAPEVEGAEPANEEPMLPRVPLPEARRPSSRRSLVAVVFASTAVLCLAASLWLSPRSALPVRPPLEMVEAFSETTEYVVPAADLRNHSVEVPLETNYPIVAQRLEGDGSRPKTEVLNSPAAGRLGSAVLLPSVLLTSGPQILFIEGGFPDQSAWRRKRLWVQRSDPEIKVREPAPGSEISAGRGVIRLRISDLPHCRVWLGDRKLPTGSSDDLEIPLSGGLPSPGGFLHPVGNLANHLLVHPIRVEHLNGSSTVLRDLYYVVRGEEKARKERRLEPGDPIPPVDRPTEVTLIDQYEKLILPWGKVHPLKRNPPLFLILGEDPAKLECRLSAHRQRPFRNGKETCLVFGDQRNIGKEEVLSIKAPGRWIELKCTWVSRGEAELDPGLVEETRLLLDAHLSFQNCEASKEESRLLLESCQALLDGKRARYAFQEQAFSAVENAQDSFEEGSRLSGQGRFEEAKVKFQRTRDELSGLDGSMLDRWDREIARTLKEAARELESRFKRAILEDETRELEALENEFRERGLSTLRLFRKERSPGRTVALSLESNASPDRNHDSLLIALLERLLVPDRPTDSLADHVEISLPSASEISVGREALRVLGKAKEPGRLLTAPGPWIGAEKPPAPTASTALGIVGASSAAIAICTFAWRGRGRPGDRL